jgi:hypothetical protein
MTTRQKVLSIGGDVPDVGFTVSQFGSVPFLMINHGDSSSDNWILGDKPQQLPATASDERLLGVTAGEQYGIASMIDRKYYLLDMAWLRAQGGDPGSISEARLVELACMPDRAGGIDRAELQQQLDLVQIEQPAACL